MAWMASATDGCDPRSSSASASREPMSSTVPSASAASSTAAAATAWVFDVSEGLALMAMSFISAEVWHDLTTSNPECARPARDCVDEPGKGAGSAGVERGAHRGDERRRPGGTLTVEQPTDQRGADHDPVGLGADLDRLGRRRDAHADEHGLVGDRLEPPGDHERAGGQVGTLAGHAEQPHRVDEAPGPGAHP